MLRHAVGLSVLIVFAAFHAQAAEKASPTKVETEIRSAVAALQEAFNRGDAKAVAACWTSDGEFVGPNAEEIIGRDKIQTAFGEFFAKHAKSKLQVSVVKWRSLTSDVVLVDLLTEMTPAPEGLDSKPNSTMLLVKQDGRWLISRMHEAVGAEPSHNIHLQPLQGYVGDWVEDGSRPSGVVVHSSCSWTANGSYLIRKFSAEGKKGIVKAGTEVIGWDPRQHRIRSWVFDADGGFGESVWTRDGARWIIKHTGTMADGNDVSITYIATPKDHNSFTIQSKDHFVGGEKQADLPEIKFKRSVVSSDTKPKAAETPKTPGHVLP